MSRIDIFAFAEGWTDRYFYDKLCQHVCEPLSIAYQVRTSEELNVKESGKRAMLGLFSYLRKKKLLVHNFKGKQIAVVFFVDKDVDDVLRIQKRSDHVIYTEYYCLENHVFRQADLADVAAVAVGLDVASVRASLGDQEMWMHSVASRWRDWVKLCLLSQLLRVNSQSNYGRPSQVNESCYGGAVVDDVERMTEQVRTASGLSVERFDAALQRVDRIVGNIYVRRQHDLVFKGKWYRGFLVEVVRQAAAGRPYNANELESSQILAVANSRVNFAQSWAKRFTQSFQKIVALFQGLGMSSSENV